MVDIGKGTVIIAHHARTRTRSRARTRILYILSIYYNIYIIYIR